MSIRLRFDTLDTSQKLQNASKWGETRCLLDTCPTSKRDQNHVSTRAPGVVALSQLPHLSAPDGVCISYHSFNTP